MEIINQGSDDIFKLESLGCCYPAGALSFEWTD
jgi:hypothetical protein